MTCGSGMQRLETFRPGIVRLLCPGRPTRDAEVCEAAVAAVQSFRLQWLVGCGARVGGYPNPKSDAVVCRGAAAARRALGFQSGCRVHHSSRSSIGLARQPAEGLLTSGWDVAGPSIHCFMCTRR